MKSAVSEQGVKIMAMLYLTPVLPLGLVSYMCGTTAMDLYSFTVAKIASLPIYLMFTFMGASAHSIIKGKKGAVSLSDEASKLEENQYLIVAGLVLSVVMISLITRKIKMELMKVRDMECLRKKSGTHYQIIDDGCWLRDTIKQRHHASSSHSFLVLPSSKCCLQVLDKQKKEKMEGISTPLIDNDDGEEKSIELGLTARRKVTTKKT